MVLFGWLYSAITIIAAVVIRDFWRTPSGQSHSDSAGSNEAKPLSFIRQFNVLISRVASRMKKRNSHFRLAAEW
jgi:hypothetical protein